MANRLICSVLEEIRQAYKTRNFSYLPGLIEEAQTLANRMEAKLYTIKDWEYLNREITRLKKEQKKLESKG